MSTLELSAGVAGCQGGGGGRPAADGLRLTADGLRLAVHHNEPRDMALSRRGEGNEGRKHKGIEWTEAVRWRLSVA